MTNITPAQAIVRGHLVVNAPALTLLLGTVLPLRTVLVQDVGALFVLAVGIATGWLWWSFMAPRWRDWVIDRGLRPEDVESLAVDTGLLWPSGSFPERTEFRRRDGRRGW